MSNFLSTKTISDLCTIIDCEHKTAPYVDNSEFLVVRTSNVRNGQLVQEDMKFTTESGYQEWTQRAVPEYGDVLFTREAPAGESCLVPEGLKVCMGQRMVLLRPKRDKVNPFYLSVMLATEKLKFGISKLSIGSTVSRINISDIKTLTIPVPPLAEQQKIAQILSTWDKAIAVTEKLLANSQQQKKALMQQLLTGKKRLLDENGVRFEGEWETVSLDRLIEISVSNSKSQYVDENGDNYIIDMGAISREGKLIPSKKTSLSVDYLIAGNLVMPKDDIGGGNIIGRVAYIDEDNKYVLGDHVYALHVKNADSMFLNYLINSYKVNKNLRRKANGTAQLGLGKNEVLKQILIIPNNIKEQVKISLVLVNADQQIETLQHKLDSLQQEKKALMQQLLTGKRRVKVAA